MKNEFDNEHFRGFAKSLELAIGQYGGLKEDEDNTARQKRQIETLIGLEREFRKLLGSHPEGMKAVEKFIHFICEERRNILDARPYFRERYGVFVSDISPAFKNRNAKTLIKFDVNYQFVHFIVKTGEWKQSGPGSRLGKEILRIERDIKKIRTELIEMNMPLAISRAKIFLGRNKRAHLDYMDLIQVAAEGLISAVDKFCLPYTPVFRSVIIGRIVGNAIEENSVDQDTILNPCGQKPKKIKDFKPGDRILGVDNQGEVIETTIVRLHDHGEREGYEVTFDDGHSLVCTENHKFLTNQGMVPIKDIVINEMEIFCEPTQKDRRLDSFLRNDESEPGLTKQTCSQLSILSANKSEEASEPSYFYGYGKYQNSKMESFVWNRISNSQRKTPTHKELSRMQADSQGDIKNVKRGLEKGESGEIQGCSEKGSRYISGPVRESAISRSIPREVSGFYEKMERGEPRGSRGSDPQLDPLSQKFSLKTRIRPERGSDFKLARDPNSLRRIANGEKTSGLRVSGSQSLGRSGRFLALLPRKGYGKTQEGVGGQTVKRQNAQRRVLEKGGCLSDQVVDAVFSTKQKTKIPTSSMAYSNAPLSNSGSLVSRRVVSYRSVGPRRMYDLEVSHPKHNFLLPNGVVTSNSKTMLHFFPSDKRKLYRANKAVGRSPSEEVDLDRIVKFVNEGSGVVTNQTEIRDLMSAASVVSADSTTPASGGDGDSVQRSVDSFASPEEGRPDVIAEHEDAVSAVALASQSLSYLEQKLLRLKGISFV